MVGVHLPDRMMAIGFWRAMLDAGIYVNVAVPPATPNGVSLLRCSLCAVHTKEQLEHMIEVMTGIGRQMGVLAPKLRVGRLARRCARRAGRSAPVRAVSMFTLAHLSDPHLPMPQARPVQLLNKRATGYYNWWRHRVHLHVPEALAGIVADIKAQKPDHIALTGDLVNVALPQEFRRAADWLAAFDTPDRITVIPGNHDVYVPIPWAEGMGLWGAYIAGDGAAAGRGLRRLPDPAPARRRSR